MRKRLLEQLEAAISKKRELDELAQVSGSFAHSLASQSMAAHIDELNQQLVALDARPAIEQFEFRLSAPHLRDGSIPLHLISRLAEEVRQMMGHAALRLSQGGLRKKRVPVEIYNDLDLRLSAVLQGSTRVLITAASNRDLLDDGLAKGAIQRVFDVLDSGGQGEAFLEAITDLGPSGAKKLRELLRLAKSNGTQMDVDWRFSGDTVRHWDGSDDKLSKISEALEAIEINDREEVTIRGVIELLSKRERIGVRTQDGSMVRILYPMRMLSKVAELHLEQAVVLRCSVTETLNPYTSETSTFYELLEIEGHELGKRS